jgi:hypothetical protein
MPSAHAHVTVDLSFHDFGVQGKAAIVEGVNLNGLDLPGVRDLCAQARIS